MMISQSSHLPLNLWSAACIAFIFTMSDQPASNWSTSAKQTTEKMVWTRSGKPRGW